VHVKLLVYWVCTLWGVGVTYVVYVYILGSGVLQIPDIFHTAGFVLISDLVVSEKLRMSYKKIITFFLWCFCVSCNYLCVLTCLSSVAYFVIL
jgi:hypothetical protein